MSQNIITLPKQLANQIAAGEVVERPVSVVKELLENSLDAGATQIELRLKNGGIDDIVLRDNGLGIAWEDLLKALEKYSTSKIKNLEDLYKVMTFGFRGEALASISSVSDFTISSKTQQCDTGSSVNTAGGEEFSQKIVAHEIGTTVQVEKLFFNTPARLSYLKKPRTEYLKIQDLVHKIALAYPQVWFTLVHDEKQVLNFPKDQSVTSRIYEVFWQEFSQNILKVSHEFSGIKVHWYISDPKISFRNKSRQVLFVNKRVIISPMISKAISDAYNRFIAHGSFPWYVLSIDIDPTQVDVNVHPRKMEVRFAEESSIFRSVFHGIKDELERVSLVQKGAFIQADNTASQKQENVQAEYYTWSGTKFKNYSPYKNTQSNPAQSWLDFTKHIMAWSWWSLENKDDVSQLKSDDLYDTPLGRIVGQLHNSYIVVQTETWMQILDQHALAERVIYERLANSQYVARTQWLLAWIWMHLISSEKEVLETYAASFANMGFDIDILSGGNIIINGVPDFIGKQNIEKIFQNILSDVSDLGSLGLEEVQHKIWAFTACRSAVKFWDPLSIFEIHQLLYDASLDYSATCPHGRPVVYDIDLQELQKKYER